MRRSVALASLVLLDSACTGSGDDTTRDAGRSDGDASGRASTPPRTGTELFPELPRHCATKPSPAPGVGVERELNGIANRGRLYALVFGDYPLHSDAETKIAWRLEGSGSVRFDAFGPAGRRTSPVWGPEEHGVSNWQRPGTEWGTGFRFAEPGCWIVQATRGDVVGVVYLDVILSTTRG